MVLAYVYDLRSPNLQALIHIQSTRMREMRMEILMRLTPKMRKAQHNPALHEIQPSKLDHYLREAHHTTAHPDSSAEKLWM
ncbi:uncharacterized protein LOC112566327 isoform X3 [Pomacea canaliculata]|uniref:uncharacterized protein LOC112566327 isoform X3 n=1 Tax=Pomacea canaliculata TaxID=400727 RepID=UPI000D73C74A|nr:uncharacterized protein LOC112566327 isoform X3 [Pomacea canaliculata]